MTRVLALTQFLIVGLGGPVLALLVKIEHKNVQPEALAKLAQFLTAHLLWLFAIPILYAAIGTALPGKIDEKLIRIAGAVICAVLLLVLGPLMVLYLL